MKLRAFAVIAALALPAAASAQPGSSPSNNGPSTGSTPSAGPQSPSSPSSGVAPRSGGASKAPSANGPSTGSSPSSGPAVPSDSPSTTGPGNGTSGKAPSTQPPSANNDQSPTTPSRQGDKFSDADSKIVAHLHHVNQMEMNLAKQAQKQGTAHVKDYANTILTDHQSNDRELTSLAKSHKLATIPADKPQTDADRQDEKDMTVSMARLKTLKGADFDKEYINMMVAGHDKELTRIDTSISAAGDPDLKSLLQSTKPVLQRHADQARDLQKSPQASLDTPAAK